MSPNVMPVAEIPADTSTLVWNGERLFQAAKLGTEMQYQHLVSEEFARKVQPTRMSQGVNGVGANTLTQQDFILA
jgi:hypothetical protein